MILGLTLTAGCSEKNINKVDESALEAVNAVDSQEAIEAVENDKLSEDADVNKVILASLFHNSRLDDESMKAVIEALGIKVK